MIIHQQPLFPSQPHIIHKLLCQIFLKQTVFCLFHSTSYVSLQNVLLLLTNKSECLRYTSIEEFSHERKAAYEL